MTRANSKQSETGKILLRKSRRRAGIAVREASDSPESQQIPAGNRKNSKYQISCHKETK